MGTSVFPNASYVRPREKRFDSFVYMNACVLLSHMPWCKNELRNVEDERANRFCFKIGKGGTSQINNDTTQLVSILTVKYL